MNYIQGKKRIEVRLIPKRSKRPCKKYGCTNLAEHPHKYCNEHSEIEEQEIRERHKSYKRYRNDIDAQEFYKSKEWLKVRELRLILDNGLCQYCLKENKITPADMVHHKIPIKVDWSKRLDIDNTESLCNSCHSKVNHKNL